MNPVRNNRLSYSRGSNYSRGISNGVNPVRPQRGTAGE